MAKKDPSGKKNPPSSKEPAGDPIAKVPFMKCMVESCQNDRIPGGTVCVDHDNARRGG
jgi:hypothetical protein